MNELHGCAKKVLGLTGTLINGYSQGIFHLLYRVAPHLMQVDDKKYTDTKAFNNEYGVTECAYEVMGPEYNSNRRTVRRKLRERQLPGVSPLVYSRFFIDSTVFLSLNDMGKDLPEYEEIPVAFNMAPEVGMEYQVIEAKFINVLKNYKEIANKVASAFTSLLTVYPDQPYDMKPILDPIDGFELISPKNTSDFETLNKKDLWLLEKVKEKIKENSKVIIYTSWVRIDTQAKLLKLFKENNIKAEALTASVAPDKREEWVENKLKKNIQVLITNPSLVETGLDLNDFPTLIYYNIGYNPFTLRQSSRRSWRINQKAPRVEVYFLYFEGALQQRALQLMASKVAVAGLVEGNFSDEGLAAMSECRDLTALLAQELTKGIKNNVEDLSEVFKKMAILKPKSEASDIIDIPEISEAQLTDGDIEDMQAKAPDYEISSLQDDSAHDVHDVYLSLFKSSIAQKKPVVKKKTVYVDPNQISIFDLAMYPA